MGKGRNKKGLSDKVRGKKSTGEKKVNPFEVKVNRQKHDILGRKVKKDEQGMPGRSRSRAFQKRKETLLVEHLKRNKVNKFVDHRIGEADLEMSVEDKMLKRFAVERQRLHSTNRFNLNEDEELTHYGQSLAEMDKFDEPTFSDEDEDNDAGKISAKMVREAHFGGFMTRKEEKPDDANKSWKERMEEMISQSKKDKHERQSEREKTIELTEKLDSEWKELRLLMGSIAKNRTEAEEKPPPPKQVDDYDKTVRTLKWEITGTPTDRLKTEEELAKGEKERLEKLEADRMRRMKGLTADEEALQKSTHRSADDLDDGLELRKGAKTMVAYKDGRLVEAEKAGGCDDDGTADQADQSGDEESGSDNDDNESEEEEEEDGSDAMEHTSDLESDDAEEKEEEEKEEEEKKEGNKEDAEEESGKTTKSVRFSENVQVGPKDIKSLLKGRKTMMDAARQELPYVFEAPVSYIDLLNLLADHSEDDQITILERMRKCNHPSLAEGNNTKLEVLFTLLVDYFCDLALQDPPCLDLMNRLTRHLYELCQMAPLPAGLHLVAQLKARQEQLTQYAEAHGGRGLFPTLDLLLLLKLVSQLFPTSDFHHHVTTPAMLLMSQTLTQCPINTRRDIGSGLFICTLFLEYVSFSKRFVPEVLNFLCGVLFLGIKKDPKKYEPVIPPFKPVGRNVGLLELHSAQSANTIKVEPFTVTDVFSRTKSRYLATDTFRVCAVSQCVKLLQAFVSLYEELPSFTEIFAPVKYFTSKLPTHLYPESLQADIRSLQGALSSHDGGQRTHLTMQKQRPQPMKMFEPQVEENFDGRKKRGGSRESNEKQRTLHKFKKEMKGAVREIRKDTQFLARQKLKETMEKDAERKRKLKELYAMLADQEGDYKRLKREKDRL